MRGKSHISLGNYLISHYFPNISRFQRQAFLLGCIEPDRNPTTYLKGSFRFQWLRGHNYPNARRFMERICRRLEGKEVLNLWDYYTLGKLIHYTQDAFTFAHNTSFPEKLSDHRSYEIALQEHFLRFLSHAPHPEIHPPHTIMEGIHKYHQDYSRCPGDLHRDSHFALQACCCVLAVLLAPKLI